MDERRKAVAKYMKLSKDEQRKFREKRSPAEPIYEEDPPWFGTSACPVSASVSPCEPATCHRASVADAS